MIITLTDFTAFQTTVNAFGGGPGSVIYFSTTGGNVRHVAALGLAPAHVEGDFQGSAVSVADFLIAYPNSRNISPTFTIKE